MRNMPTSKLLAPLAAALLLPAASSCGSRVTGATGEKQRLVPVHVIDVDRSDVAEVLVYSVDLEPATEVKVYSMLSETIMDFPWDDGDEIEKGQRVALIRTKGLSASIAQISAQQEGLDVQIGTAADQLERSEKLLASNTISKTEYDQMKSAYLGLMAQKKALTAGKGQVSDTRNKGDIRAPISGLVADKRAEVGDMASPAMPLCRILEVSHLKATLDLVEQDVPKVSVGLKVLFSMDAWPDRTFSGEIASILPYLDVATRTNRVEVVIENPPDEVTGTRPLKPGMYGTAHLVVAERKGVVVAPEYALLMDSELLARQEGTELFRKAFVIDASSVAHERIVTLGIRQGSDWEILDGLEKGERIVIRGQHGLVDGQNVEVVKMQ